MGAPSLAAVKILAEWRQSGGIKIQDNAIYSWTEGCARVGTQLLQQIPVGVFDFRSKDKGALEMGEILNWGRWACEAKPRENQSVLYVFPKSRKH